MELLEGDVVHHHVVADERTRLEGHMLGHERLEMEFLVLAQDLLLLERKRFGRLYQRVGNVGREQAATPSGGKLGRLALGEVCAKFARVKEQRVANTAFEDQVAVDHQFLDE